MTTTNFVDMSTEELLTIYHKTNEEMKQLDNKLKAIKEIVADRMHRTGQNEMFVYLKEIDKFYHPKYNTRQNKSTNYKLLFETVGPQKYNDIVKNTESTYLSIKPANKEEEARLRAGMVDQKSEVKDKVHAMPAPPVGI